MKKTDDVLLPSGLELAKAETNWVFQNFIRRTPELTDDPTSLTWENSNPDNKPARIAKMTAILTSLAPNEVTAEALAKADLAWENQRVINNLPEYKTLLATWESHSQGWRDQELTKWREILAAARLTMMGA